MLEQLLPYWERLTKEHQEAVRRLLSLYGPEVVKRLKEFSPPEDYDKPIGRLVFTATLAGIEDYCREKRGLEPRWEGVF